MRFTKMQGCGNDYIYVNAMEERVESPGRLAKAVSDRHFGIGADGLILIGASKTADFSMEMYNADGSKGAMCGNGIRCVGKYVYEHGLTRKTTLTIETGSGNRVIHLQTGENLNEIVAFVNGRSVMPHGQKQDQHQRGDGRRQGDPEIALEFVLHGAALTVAGGNGGVGDEGQVVAEHGSAHDASGTQRRVEAGRLGDFQCNGHDEGDGADGGSHSGGD